MQLFSSGFSPFWAAVRIRVKTSFAQQLQEFPFLSPQFLNSLLQAFQARSWAQYGIRKQESAVANGGHLQTGVKSTLMSPAAKWNPAAEYRLHFCLQNLTSSLDELQNGICSFFMSDGVHAAKIHGHLLRKQGLHST
jgi:hypothetical protein